MARKKDRDNKNIKAAGKVIKEVAPTKTQVKKVVRKSGFHRAVPYIVIIFALLFALFLALRESAGTIGELISELLRGIFGGAALLLPLGLGFVGVLWCILHFKETAPKRDEEEQTGLRRARRRTVSKTVLVFLFIILLSSLLGVISDPSDVDVELLWSDGAEELLVGGIVGGAIGWLMNYAFSAVISAILLVILLLIVLCFIVGLTPDYIITRIRCARELRDSELETDADADRQAYEQMRIRELERAKKKKQRVQRRAIREELEEDDEPALVPPVQIPKKKQRTAEQPQSSDDFNEFQVDEEDTEQYSEPQTTAIEMDGQSDTEAYGSGEAKDYGGCAEIDGDTHTAEELMKNLSTQRTAEQTADEETPKEPEEIELGEISEETLSEDLAGVLLDEAEEEEEEIVTPYVFPPVEMLSPNKNPIDTDVTAELQENARILKETLKSFKVDIREISYSRGPTITRYELKPEVGTRVRSIANLVDDIALSLATSGVRIEAPIPNKPAVGIEVPNRNRATVYLRDLIENSKFTDSKSRISSCLGMDVGGNPVYFDVAKMPHLLIAGTTGSGKSVCINTIILSILYKARPNEVKLILVDPKQVEFTVYENIPHLYCPIVSEPKKAAGALASAVSEMERRFELIRTVGVRNIEAYNEVTANDPEKEYLPKMVIIIDELADLMMTARDEVETSICRLAQKARAAGIHVILGTQRPSVDVITGLIKANIPSRIACTVTSQVDSRTIIDVAGAENLIGYGDMLFAPVGSAKPMRVQGAFVSDSEVEKIVTFIKEKNAAVKYNSDFINSMEENAKLCGVKKGGAAPADMDTVTTADVDPKFTEAVKLAIEEGKISTSLMQRRLGVGYGRAAKIIDHMFALNYITAPDGNKPRVTKITMQEYMDRTANGTLSTGGSDEAEG